MRNRQRLLFRGKKTFLALLAFSVLMSVPFFSAYATPVTQANIESNIDWTTAGVGGVGGGTGTINVTGVSGTVIKAFLYWHGIDNSGAGAVYDNATVSINGNAVTGVSLGDATTNCWGAGSSRAFRADVTTYVSGNGAYTITGLSALPGHNANGASLVVIFNDGNNTNNRDLVFFEGNDSNIPGGFPGEDAGWNATLADISYGGGSVGAQLHLVDGQTAGDGTLTFAGSGTVTIPDAVGLYDGSSVPTAGTSRALNGQLWDIHNFDITGAFGAPGLHTLTVSGQQSSSDCLGLVLLLVDLEAGSAPGIEGPPNSPSCSDSFDNDGDGLIDLNDPDCQFADATPPSCILTAVIPGPPTQIKVTTQDTGSGLASITPLISTNAVVTYPPFTPGTTDPVVVTGTKINQSQRAQVMLEVKDVAGNTTTCDPVLTLLVRKDGKPVTETLTDIPDIESQITIANGSPGIKNLLVTVNGVEFQVNGLKDFEKRSFDVSAAMHEGDNNTITLTAWGKPGSQATIIISE